jgi:catechol 2,3-dioxygenase-like lactoylglutathione lyase family enzyme
MPAMPNLETASTHPMVAVSDLARAREFYEGTLGLIASDFRSGAVRYDTRGETWFMVYESNHARAAETTCMKFEVPDVYATVKALRENGIVFEEYDVPGLKTVDGVAEHKSGARGAWFKDPEGNILQIGQYE